MRRREFIILIGSVAVARPLAAPAQQPAMPVVGWLGSGTEPSERHLLTAFHDGLAEGGFVVGRNVTIEYRAAEGRYDRLPAMAADLIRRKVALIAASGPPAALAAKATTRQLRLSSLSAMILSSSGWLEVSISRAETLRVQPFSLARLDQSAWTLRFDSRPIRPNSASSLIRIHPQRRIKFRICRLRRVLSGVRCMS